MKTQAMERISDKGGIEQLERKHDRTFPIHNEDDACNKEKQS